MASIALRNVGKVYGNGTEAVRNLTLDIADKEFVVFVGPSGCGKSTVLQLIAGLEEATSGEVWIDGRMVNDVEPRDRDVAMVFQNYALYPYKTVYDNMAFGLKMHKVPRAEIRERVGRAAEMLGLTEVLRRKPGELSGGQRQRVAMGRAIVREPKAFLMDEPLSNLDAKLRSGLRRELAHLHRELGATFVYVTHDQTEAMTLATRIVVLDKGEVQQVGTPQQVYDEPANMFVAGFIGTPSMSFLPGRCVVADGRIKVETGGALLDLPSAKEEAVAARGLAGSEVLVGIRPEDVREAGRGEAGPQDGGAGGRAVGVLRARVTGCEMTGSDAYLAFRLGEGADAPEALARADARTASREGDLAAFEVNLDRLHLFDPGTGEAVSGRP